ncbi:hypothetical protein [Mycolicibacterium fortuitum]|uniref:hypothetical protein n=1 Tax=Mycolicibacterium fortuitum TaxID=1766 RepID=UPI00262482A0|nr:hypothetical protein [Mycolicibacterium fortuitum]
MTTAGLTLRDLILTLKGDRTYKQLEEASGGVVKAQRWNQITNGIRVREFPEPNTLVAMAATLGVSTETVILATARSIGILTTTNSAPLIGLLPPDVDRLNDQQLTAVLATIRALLNATPDDTKPARKGRAVGQRKKPTPGQHT